MGGYIVRACLYRQLPLIGEVSLLVEDLLDPLLNANCFEKSEVKETLDNWSLALMVGYPWERPNIFPF